MLLVYKNELIFVIFFLGIMVWFDTVLILIMKGTINLLLVIKINCEKLRGWF